MKKLIILISMVMILFVSCTPYQSCSAYGEIARYRHPAKYWAKKYPEFKEKKIHVKHQYTKQK